jgi:hypothetical protein
MYGHMNIKFISLQSLHSFGYDGISAKLLENCWIL